MNSNESLFNSQGISIIGTHKRADGGPTAKLTMGKGKGVEFLFPMLDVSKGVQADRVQVDVTLGGSINVSGGVNNGVGTYQMQFLDGPIIDTEQLFGKKIEGLAPTAAEQYLNAAILQDRQIKVEIISPPVTCPNGTTKSSTKAMAVFNGIATALHITLSTDGDMRIIKTQVDAVGGWE